VLGGTPFSVAFTITMARIVLSPYLSRPRSPGIGTTTEFPEIDIVRQFFLHR